LFFFLTFILYAQQSTLAWAKSTGGTSPYLGYEVNEGPSVAIDASGNVYTTGYFTGTPDFDPGSGIFSLTATGVDDIFVSKLDASGNLVWAKRKDYAYYTIRRCTTCCMNVSCDNIHKSYCCENIIAVESKPISNVLPKYSIGRSVAG